MTTQITVKQGAAQFEVKANRGPYRVVGKTPKQTGYSNVNQDILPDADSTRDIGSSSKGWAEIYGDNVYQGGNRLACELIESQTLSGASELVIDDLSSDYWMYEVVIPHLSVATDSTNLRLRTSTDNGSNWDSGSSDYVTKLRYSWGSSSYTMFYSQDGLPALALGLGNATNETSSLVLRIFNPSAAEYTRIETTLYGRDNSGTFGEFVGFVTRQSAADVDAIRVFADSGNISGGVRVYGYRAA